MINLALLFLFSALSLVPRDTASAIPNTSRPGDAAYSYVLGS